MDLARRLSELDRRVVFLAVGVFLVGSMAVVAAGGGKLPMPAGPLVQAVHERVEALPPRSPVLVAFDYDPASEAELYPMSLALLRHCFRKNHRVMCLTLWPGGAGLIERALAETAREFGRRPGTDYVNFGYKPGTANVIISAGQDFPATFPRDARGEPVAAMEAAQGIRSLRDVSLVIDLAAGATVDSWVAYGVEKYRFPLAAGTTAVMAPDCYPYIDARQLVGLLGGLKGAADYEALIGAPGRGVAGMFPQSVVHLLIILFILLGNVAWFLSRRGRTP
jgi:hypothetical protein